MKPRPFYRWKSFWLGLCVLVFLGWAWRDSTGAGKGVYWRGGGFAVYASTRDGVANLGKDRSQGRNNRFNFWNLPAGNKPDQVPLPGIIRGPYDGLRLQTPFWLLISCFAALWVGWLFWHWKREQKKSS